VANNTYCIYSNGDAFLKPVLKVFSKVLYLLSPAAHTGSTT